MDLKDERAVVHDSTASQPWTQSTVPRPCFCEPQPKRFHPDTEYMKGRACVGPFMFDRPMGAGDSQPTLFGTRAGTGRPATEAPPPGHPLMMMDDSAGVVMVMGVSGLADGVGGIQLFCGGCSKTTLRGTYSFLPACLRG